MHQTVDGLPDVRDWPLRRKLQAWDLTCLVRNVWSDHPVQSRLVTELGRPALWAPEPVRFMTEPLSCSHRNQPHVTVNVVDMTENLHFLFYLILKPILLSAITELFRICANNFGMWTTFFQWKFSIWIEKCKICTGLETLWEKECKIRSLIMFI